MQMQGQRELPVSQALAWHALNDPAILKACIPGCDSIEASDAEHFKVSMAIRIGPVSARFQGLISLLDVRAPEAYTLRFEGQGGTAGFGKGQSQVVLEAQPDGCLLRYTVEAQMGGKIAQLGQRLIDGAANKLAEDFFKRLEAELVRVADSQEPVPAGAPAPQASPEQPFAVGPQPRWVLGLVALGLAALAWWALS